MQEDFPLEEALARFQRRQEQVAAVVDASGEWTGIITLEDVLEKLVGKLATNSMRRAPSLPFRSPTR